MRKNVMICTNGACGGECYSCRCTRLTVKNIRLEGELRDSQNLLRGMELGAENLRTVRVELETEKKELLDVLKKTAPILDAFYVEMGSQAVLAGGDPRAWKLVRDLVELTIKTIDPDWESPREKAEADALSRRN